MPRRAPLLLTLLLVVPLLVLTTGAPAQACSCASSGPRRMLATSEVAFAGTVEGGRDGAGDDRVTRVRVGQVWKGEASEVTEVVHGTDGASCGVEFSEGQRLVLYADRGADELRTSLCSVRVGLAEVDRAVEVLGEGAEPAAGTTEAASSGGPPRLPLVAGGLLLLAAGAWVVVRRRTGPARHPG